MKAKKIKELNPGRGAAENIEDNRVARATPQII
jgi:hypothetical protein